MYLRGFVNLLLLMLLLSLKLYFRLIEAQT